MNKDLCLAIISMDSYNRGYGARITNISEAGLVGNAEILDFDLPSGSQNAGFYAIAYDVTGVDGFANGETVISFRGTDNIPTDALNAYSLAIG